MNRSRKMRIITVISKSDKQISVLVREKSFLAYTHKHLRICATFAAASGEKRFLVLAICAAATVMSYFMALYVYRFIVLYAVCMGTKNEAASS